MADPALTQSLSQTKTSRRKFWTIDSVRLMYMYAMFWKRAMVISTSLCKHTHTKKDTTLRTPLKESRREGWTSAGVFRGHVQYEAIDLLDLGDVQVEGYTKKQKERHP